MLCFARVFCDRWGLDVAFEVQAFFQEEEEMGERRRSDSDCHRLGRPRPDGRV